MKLVVMGCATGNGEFIADLDRKTALLGECKMVGVARLSAAYQARLRTNKLQMSFVAEATLCTDGEFALVDPLAIGNLGWLQK